MILLDTNVLSEAYRRTPRGAEPPAARAILARLVAENRALAIPGIVVQELLSGIRAPTQFDLVRDDLESFQVLLATRDDHLLAARIMIQCLENGVVSKTVDCLIAAQSVRQGGELYTYDRDFERIALHSELRVYRPDPAGSA